MGCGGGDAAENQADANSAAVEAVVDVENVKTAAREQLVAESRGAVLVTEDPDSLEPYVELPAGGEECFVDEMWHEQEFSPLSAVAGTTIQDVSGTFVVVVGGPPSTACASEVAAAMEGFDASAVS